MDCLVVKRIVGDTHFEFQLTEGTEEVVVHVEALQGTVLVLGNLLVSGRGGFPRGNGGGFRTGQRSAKGTAATESSRAKLLKRVCILLCHIFLYIYIICQR